MSAVFETPQQKLAPEAYLSEAWYERERRELFNRSWTFACTEADLAANGDYHCFRFMDYSLFVIRDDAGVLRAYHNLCRHRGCEVLEGSGNSGSAIVCPYHRWTYRLDGSLRGVPNEAECFTDLDRSALGLLPAAVGTYRGMVFVNPSETPPDDFSAWIADMDRYGWPHRFDDGSMEYSGAVTYEMQCNWKVFYENAIDGYHLGYLHDQTLGKVYPDRNVWKAVGRNVVWYSTERDGVEKSNTVLTEQTVEAFASPRVTGAETADYPGVVMLFPLTIVSPSPWGMYISLLEPAGPEVTYMRTLSWAPAGSGGRHNFQGEQEIVRLSDLEGHPLESGNFQIEDMWICEKIQRNLRSPNYRVGPLADGAGAESPLPHFQDSVLHFLNA